MRNGKIILGILLLFLLSYCKGQGVASSQRSNNNDPILLLIKKLKNVNNEKAVENNLEVQNLYSSILSVKTQGKRDYYFKRAQYIDPNIIQDINKEAVDSLFTGRLNRSFYEYIIAGNLNLTIDVDRTFLIDNSSTFGYKSPNWAALLYLAKLGDDGAVSAVFNRFDNEADLSYKFGVLTYHIAYINSQIALDKIISLLDIDTTISLPTDEIPIVRHEKDPRELYLPLIFNIIFKNYKIAYTAKLKEIRESIKNSEDLSLNPIVMIR
jgi:hypothetical protein